MFQALTQQICYLFEVDYYQTILANLYLCPRLEKFNEAPNKAINKNYSISETINTRPVSKDITLKHDIILVYRDTDILDITIRDNRDLIYYFNRLIGKARLYTP